jgi:hypothetical protein
MNDKELRALAFILENLEDNRQSSGLNPTEQDIADEVDQALANRTFAMLDRLALLDLVRSRMTVLCEDAKAISGNRKHVEWLTPERRESIQWRFWTRYRLHLLEDLPRIVVTKSVDQATDRILGYLEDPGSEGPWDVRGLVMGHVQSGKTANYTGLICKAVDAGFNVIIVLAGMHNNLRSQTQIRLEEGFLGFDTTVRRDGSRPIVGVGHKDPSLKSHYLTRRHDPISDEHGDFNRSGVQAGIAFGGGIPVVAVVKKNSRILENLINWLKQRSDYNDPSTGKSYFRDASILVIDDEADQASLDTAKAAVDENGSPDPDYDPSKINGHIRRLLALFRKSAYVGYTATPFANVFIDEKAYTSSYEEDLFPRDFIVSLPTPDNYTGAARIFGIEPHFAADLNKTNGIPIVRFVSDHANSLEAREKDGWMPPLLTARTGHVPRFRGIEQVPESLTKAICSFFVASVIRGIRNPRPHHNSMLIHVTRFQAVQSRVRKQVQQHFYAIRDDLAYQDSGPFHDLITDLVETDFRPTTAHELFGGEFSIPTASRVLERLKTFVQTVKIKEIHGESDDILDYEANRATGINVIAIGGDKLSRGLTLEGLVTSYFLRSSKMYDTLMQMGRWFGYRVGYEDLCRIYTTTDLFSWFRHLALASEELREEFDFMERLPDVTPKDFGLKVLRHPLMMVTSRTKMKTGTRIRISFAGSRPQTVTFSLRENVLRKNKDALITLIGRLGSSRGTPLLTSEKGKPAWDSVGLDIIIEFLSSIECSGKARVFDPVLINRYISLMSNKGELINWTVMLCGIQNGVRTSIMIGDTPLVAIKRSPATAPDNGSFTIGVLTDPDDEAFDLDDEEKAYARELKPNAKSIPPEAVRTARHPSKALLMIYPIAIKESFQKGNYELDYIKHLNGDELAIGVAISFPTTDRSEFVEYHVNNIYDEQHA